MRLIHVTAILDLETSIYERSIDLSKEISGEFYGLALAEKGYAILSHCWGVAENGEKEVSFQEMEQLTTMNEEKRNEIRRRTGYKKIIDTCKQAQKDGLEWVWVDTCCIDKKSSSELSEAINSMYRWYANAKQCYAYIHDATWDSWLYKDEVGTIHSSAKWFTRGWTLQELIAPEAVHFFDSKWNRLGDKKQLASHLGGVTRIPVYVLQDGLGSGRPGVAQIMSWAADRTTTREEDRAYSLLGLLGVHMPMLYGEGKNAFRRLQLEIIRSSNDQSIFAWGQKQNAGCSGNFLAEDPSCFRDCSDIVPLSRQDFIDALQRDAIAKETLHNIPAERFRTFAATNDGIQIWLPTETFGKLAEVKLACSYEPKRSNYYSNIPITMNLVLSQSGCFRFFGGRIPKAGPIEFKQHFLPYNDVGQNPSSFTFELDCQTLSLHNFLQYGVNPKSIQVEDGSVTLSKDNDFAAITYVNKWRRTCFSVVLVYCCGRDLVFIVCPSKPLEWQEVQLLRICSLERLLGKEWKPEIHCMEHAHLRRSIQHVRVVTTRHSCGVGCKVTIDVVRCSGCCSSQKAGDWNPWGWSEAPQLPGIMRDGATANVKYTWHVDGSPTSFYPTKSEIRPGDYGQVSRSGHNFKRQGNIFELATQLGISGPFDLVENIISHPFLTSPAEDVLIAPYGGFGAS